MTIGTVIRRWRQERGLTQQQLETATGIEQRYLSALELDKVRQPGPFKLYRILRALDHSLEDLIQECGEADDTAALLRPAVGW